MCQPNEMSPADVLNRMRVQAGQHRVDSGLFTPGELISQKKQDRAAVAALIEREAALESRLRSVCQTLVEAVGADGPCNAEDAAARLIAERDALAYLHAAVLRNGEWDDGCFYYAGRAAPELQHALSGIDKARAEARKPEGGAP